jgi:hypothetical protein
MSTRARQTPKGRSHRSNDLENQVSTRSSSQSCREKCRLKSKPSNPVPVIQTKQGFGRDEGRDESCGHQMAAGRQGAAQAQMVEDRGVIPLGDATNLTPRKRQRLGEAEPDHGERGEVQMHVWDCFEEVIVS